MKKIILPLIIAVTSLSVHINAQVGVNTQTPASTLDVRAKETTGTSAVVEGLLIPRVDRQKAQSMTGVPVSTMIYINSTATGAQTGTAINIDAEGYYYFNGTAWTKLAGNTPPANNIYTNDGTLADNRTVTQGANTLAFTGTATNAFSVDGTTFSVDAANNKIGIGNNTPGTALDVNGAITNRETSIAVSANAVSIPANTSQVQLTGAATADVTVTAPAAPNAGQRLIVYNNTTGDFGAILNGNTVLNGQTVEFIYSNNAWRTTDNGASNPTVPVSNFWRLNGNTGTIPANNFIGTTNNVGFAIRTNNTERMRITNNGNIGIGTTAPTGIVNIVADNKGSGAGNDLYFDGYGTSTNPVIFLGSAGGTAAVPTNLTNGTLIGGLVFKPRVNGNWQFTSSGMYSNYVGDGTTNLTNLRFVTSGSERVTIDQTGNVGIGTTTPQKTLHVTGTVQFGNEINVGGTATTAGSPGTAGQVLTSAGANAAPTWTTPTTTVDTNTNIYNIDGTLTGDRIVTQTDKTLSFITDNTKVNAFSVDGTTLSVDALNNRLGIGTAAPTNVLHINGTNPLRLDGLETATQTATPLVVDASGIVKKELTLSSQLIVNASGGADITGGTAPMVNNAFFPVVLTEIADADNQYDPATGTFTAAADGLFFINSHFNFSTSGGTFDGASGKLYGMYTINGGALTISSLVTILRGTSVQGGNNYNAASTNLTLYLKAGDAVKIGCLIYGMGTMAADAASVRTHNSAGNKSSFVKIYRLK